MAIWGETFITKQFWSTNFLGPHCCSQWKNYNQIRILHLWHLWYVGRCWRVSGIVFRMVNSVHQWPCSGYIQVRDNKTYNTFQGIQKRFLNDMLDSLLKVVWNKELLIDQVKSLDTKFWIWFSGIWYYVCIRVFHREDSAYTG